MHILAINCGSSSIKGKLYQIPSKDAEAKVAASLSVSGISSKGEKVKISVKWTGEKGTDVDEEGEDGGSVECESVWSHFHRRTLIKRQESRASSTEKIDRIWRCGRKRCQVHHPQSVRELATEFSNGSVHGGARKEGIVITKKHDEGLAEMDKLSEFAPLHVRRKGFDLPLGSMYLINRTTMLCSPCDHVWKHCPSTLPFSCLTPCFT